MEVEHQFEVDGGELLIGCGNNRNKYFVLGDEGEDENTAPALEWTKLTTLDMDSACDPDYVWDLNHMPLPFADNCFDEIHAYEVLEHTGQQGDFRFFFKQFEEFWRILRPGGLFYATVPMWDTVWAWGDPGHTRVINSGTLTFLSQEMYSKDVGNNTPMSDYRSWYSADFRVMYHNDQDGVDAERFMFVLKALKDG